MAEIAEVYKQMREMERRLEEIARVIARIPVRTPRSGAGGTTSSTTPAEVQNWVSYSGA